MKFVQCKNTDDKLLEIVKFCTSKIKENNYQINYLVSQQESQLDYADELHELRLRNTQLEVILRIANAGENETVLVQ